jgi:hypothetical protein
MSVGLEVAIEKSGESEAEVEYRFLVREGCGGLVVPRPTGHAGYVTLHRSTGRVALRSPCPDDSGEVLYSRVVSVLTRHWRMGEYPSTTRWAG